MSLGTNQTQSNRKATMRWIAIAALGALLTFAGHERASATDPSPNNYLVEINSDTTANVYCEVTDDQGYMQARSYKTASKTVQAIVLSNGSSSQVNGRINCGSDCNSAGCMPRWRRTDIETAVNATTSSRSCTSSETYKSHGCEIWAPPSYYHRESIVSFWLGPVGSAFELVNMNTSTYNNILSGKSFAGGSCGPAGC